MHQAQGLAPFDPFHTLQLQSSAPRDLIAGAAALLVARARCDGNELRVASLTLARDAALSLARDRPARRGPDDGHYRVLGVAEDADAEIISLAYRVAVAALPADAPGAPPSPARLAIEEARATLTNTYRRARYDAELHASPAVAAVPVPIAPRPPAAPIASAEPVVSPSPEAPLVATPHADRPLDAVAVRNDIAEQLPLAFDPPPAVAARRGVLRRRVRNRPKKLSAPVELRPHVAPVLPRLTDEGELIAELRFIDGPLAGATVPIADGKLTLGPALDDDVRLAGAAPASLRIWRLDGRYLLRRIEGEIRIDGRSMTLPAAALEAGMVVETGPHRAVFAFRRLPQALLPMLSAAARADDRVAR